MYSTFSVLPCFHFNRVTGKTKEKYNPDRYPLKLSLTFNKAQIGLRDYLKEQLDKERKSELRYRISGKYSFNVEVYGMDVLSYNNFLNALGHSQIELWDRKILDDDKRIFPDDLYRQGQKLYERHIEMTMK
jgi:hypothetical protein